MPGHSKIWIYQANRALTATESEYLIKGLQDLCEQWSAHGAPLRTSFVLKYNRFAVLAVDEGASGCSIDASVRFLKSLQAKLGIDFFDRTQVTFLQDGAVVSYPMMELKVLFESQKLGRDTIVFNNVAGTKDEWIRGWQVTAGESWLSRHLPKSAVAN